MGNKLPANRPSLNSCETCTKKFDQGGISRFWKSCTSGKSALIDRHVCAMCSKLICNDCAKRRKLVALCRECCGKEERKTRRRAEGAPSKEGAASKVAEVPEIALRPEADLELQMRSSVTLVADLAPLADFASDLKADSCPQAAAAEDWDAGASISPGADMAAVCDQEAASLAAAEKALMETEMEARQAEHKASLAAAERALAQSEAKAREAASAAAIKVARTCALKMLRRVSTGVITALLQGSIATWSAQCFAGNDIEQELDELTISLSQDFGGKLMLRIMDSTLKANLIHGFGQWKSVSLEARAEMELDELTLTLTQHSGTRLMSAIFRRHQGQQVLSAFTRWNALMMVRWNKA